MLTISLVIPTISRPTLVGTLRSLVGQDWRAGDEVLLVGDGPRDQARALWEQLAARGLPGRYLENPGPAGTWGHHARNWVLDTHQARGSHLMALDDDDAYAPGAIATVRAALAAAPDRPHLFRMRYADGRELWAGPEVREGNVGNPMFVAPNEPARLGRWGVTYEGDCAFIRATCAHYPGGPVWHEDVICLVRPGR